MAIRTGYAIADIAALKALTSTSRTDGYSRLVKSDASGKPAWYTFINASTATGDDDSVVLPQDNPSTGRWLKSGSSSGGGSGGSSGLTVLTTQTQYNASFGERILVCGSNSLPPVVIHLPNSPVYGNEIEIISGGSVAKISVGSGGTNFPPRSVDTIVYWFVGSYSGSFYAGGKLIYGNDGTRDSWLVNPAPNNLPSGYFAYESTGSYF